jgi:hypothetical protein
VPLICPTTQATFFSQEGWARFSQNCPSGKSLGPFDLKWFRLALEKSPPWRSPLSWRSGVKQRAQPEGVKPSGSPARKVRHRSWAVPHRTEHQESAMISEIQVHTIARQMLEKHGPSAIAEAAQNAQASEKKGDTEEAREWRHIEEAMKLMRGPHQS